MADSMKLFRLTETRVGLLSGTTTLLTESEMVCVSSTGGFET